MHDSPLLLSLPSLADAMKLPRRWLKAEADAGRIPHFRVGHRYRFDLHAVESALAERAQKGGPRHDR